MKTIKRKVVREVDTNEDVDRHQRPLTDIVQYVPASKRPDVCYDLTNIRKIVKMWSSRNYYTAEVYSLQKNGSGTVSVGSIEKLSSVKIPKYKLLPYMAFVSKHINLDDVLVIRNLSVQPIEFDIQLSIYTILNNYYRSQLSPPCMPETELIFQLLQLKNTLSFRSLNRLPYFEEEEISTNKISPIHIVQTYIDALKMELNTQNLSTNLPVYRTKFKNLNDAFQRIERRLSSSLNLKIYNQILSRRAVFADFFVKICENGPWALTPENIIDLFNNSRGK